MYQSFSICFYFSNTTFVKDENTQCQKRYLEWIPRWKIQFFRTKNVLKESVIFCPGKNFNTTCDISVATLPWTNYSPEIQNFVEFPFFFLWGRPCKIFFFFCFLTTFFFFFSLLGSASLTGRLLTFCKYLLTSSFQKEKRKKKSRGI